MAEIRAHSEDWNAWRDAPDTHGENEREWIKDLRGKAERLLLAPATKAHSWKHEESELAEFGEFAVSLCSGGARISRNLQYGLLGLNELGAAIWRIWPPSGS